MDNKGLVKLKLVVGMPKGIFRYKPYKKRPEEHSGQEKPAGMDLTELELERELEEHDKFSALFLGSFDLPRIRFALKKFGITQQLASRGYHSLDLEFRPRGPFEHFLRIYNDEAGKRELLGEVILKESRYQPCGDHLDKFGLPALNLLCIEWMLMQNIHGEFSADRPRLPGQNFPGLGVGNQVVALLEWVSRMIHKDGLMNIPEYFHNALFYSKWFKFIDPHMQGTMEAIYAQLTAQGHGIASLSFAVYFECLRDAQTGEPFAWTPHEQVLPLCESLRTYFARPEYEEMVAAHRARVQVTVDERTLAEKLATVDEIDW